MSSSFSLPIEFVECRYEIKKSEFYCALAPVSSREEAMAELGLAKKRYPGARHHCWAYIFGDPKQPLSQAFNDDGEPAGTAGKPILNVLQHRRVGNCMAIVSRYFGGTKLGAGGLVRAYSASTQQAVEHCPMTEFVAVIEVGLRCAYALEPELRRFLASEGAALVNTLYEEQVEFQFEFPQQRLPELKRWLGAHFEVQLLKALPEAP